MTDLIWRLSSARPAAVAGRLLLGQALDRPLPTLAEAGSLLAPAAAFMGMCLMVRHADLEPGCLAGTELAEVVGSMCQQLTALGLGTQGAAAELASSVDFGHQRLNALGLQANVSLTMLRACSLVGPSTGSQEAVVRAAAAMLPLLTATLQRGTAAQRAGQVQDQPVAHEYAGSQVALLVPILPGSSPDEPESAVEMQRLGALLIQAAPAWPAWLGAVLEALESGPADVASHVEGDRPALLRQLLCSSASWVERLPPAPPEGIDAEACYCPAWVMAVQLLGQLCEDADAVSDEEPEEEEEEAEGQAPPQTQQQRQGSEGAAAGAAAAAEARAARQQEWQASREAAAAALPSAAAGFRRMLLDWPAPQAQRLQAAGQLLRPLALIPHFARGGGSGGSMSGGALAACRLASTAMQAHCIGTELMYQDNERFQTNYELPKSQYMLDTEAQSCCTLAAEQALRELSAAAGGTAGAATAAVAPTDEAEQLAQLLWGLHLACHRIIQSVCRQPLKLVEHLFSAALAAFDAALAVMDARPQTRRALSQRQALCGAHANLLWQLVSSLQATRYWPSEMGRRIAAQLPAVATGVPAGFYTASDKLMASFMTQLNNSTHDVQDQALMEFRDPRPALVHGITAIDNALLASPRLLVTLVAQCGNRLAPRPGQLAASTFVKLLPAARQASREVAGSKLGRQLADTADGLEAALRAEVAAPAVHLAQVKELGMQLARRMHQPRAAAGESGSKLRCGACRAVNYCSRECATQDWKTGGHKRVCKALAAARQGEQPAQQGG
ncbi:Zinc finger MYND domain-containing 10 [Chlorella sorokiniana]|uniref:Zinc finger MYND domain-containing 10 n=1 Tax=Chlorella sorokiniana TaxID=3076 RepID=A0A2P6TVL1_CHLSO|nr:Zinc finger MYND domain-containing 10 [Chlorella sorokiniana]|eukprot:PRW58101.1 Zinc finger MYND domain-containing 10 [Chlorella sorokiniana]